ncbi:MAG: hypothetical protein J6334_04185 [Kiritimatiellae bacterium]|nr:hypothetical protein [Kiritimatiellia bacterium]
MKRWLAGVPVVWAAVAAAGTGDGWQTDLWLGRGEVWRSRVAVEIAASGGDVSEGEAVAVPVAALAGQRAEAVRVTDRSGRLLLFAPFARGTGERITAGALPGDVELLLPYTGATNGVARYWVYFDNPSAWALADFLPGETEHPVNGDFEQGDPDPVGWKRGEVTEGQRLSVETDRPFSGKRCIKAVSPETVPASWFGWKRSDFRVVPGAEVTVRVRVRGEGVKGNAGWYVHIGNAQDGQIVNQVFKAGEGSFDWREQVIRLTVPEGCTRLSTGSVLYGSGTAWYDAFSIDLGRQREKPAVKVGAVERLKIREIGRDAPWVEGRWHHRVPIRIVNLSEREEKGLLVTADLAQAVRAVRNPRFLLTLEGKEREIHRMGERLFFSCDLPPETILTYYLYVATEGRTAASGEGVESAAGSVIPSDQVLRERAGRADRETARRLVESAANLVRNPGFEEGEMGWSRNDAPAGVRYGIAEEGCMGKRCVTCSIAKEAPEGWYGWRQTVSVEAGKRYLYGGWIASRDVTSDLRIHVHLLDANHRVVDGGYLSTPGNCIGEAWQPTFGRRRFRRAWSGWSCI